MKTLCELAKKDLARHAQKMISGEAKVKFICEKCARVSDNKKQLCEAKKYLG